MVCASSGRVILKIFSCRTVKIVSASSRLLQITTMGTRAFGALDAMFVGLEMKETSVVCWTEIG